MELKMNDKVVIKKSAPKFLIERWGRKVGIIIDTCFEDDYPYLAQFGDDKNVIEAFQECELELEDDGSF